MKRLTSPTYSYSEQYYEKVRGTLPSIKLKEELDKVCKPLRQQLEKNDIEGSSSKCVRV
jgi:hypothetical protein